MTTTQRTGQTRASELVLLSDAAGRPDEVGVKAANLGAVMAAGFPVPDGVVLSLGSGISTDASARVLSTRPAPARRSLRPPASRSQERAQPRAASSRPRRRATARIGCVVQASLIATL
jgi:hypothetical protein